MSQFFQGQFLSFAPAIFYATLFLLIYVETALVITFFMPGDTILFSAGLVVAVSGDLNIWITCFVISSAAVIGDNTAYVLGNKYGESHIEKKNNLRITNFFRKSQKFYQKHGVATIYLARFYPWLRTLIPFSAGVSKMSYRSFWLANILGGVSWAFGITLLGYFANSIAILKDSSRAIALFFVLLTLALTLKNYLQSRRSQAR